MALQFTHTMDTGVVIPTAYVRVSEIRTSHVLNQDVHNFELQIFNSLADYNNGKRPVQGLRISKSYDDTASLSFADIYAYLKTLPEFAGAIDV